MSEATETTRRLIAESKKLREKSQADHEVDGPDLIVGTILTGFGLGHLLHYGRELHAMDQVIGVMLIIVLIGLLTDKILFAPIERFLHRRWGTGLR